MTDKEVRAAIQTALQHLVEEAPALGVVSRKMEALIS